MVTSQSLSFTGLDRKSKLSKYFRQSQNKIDMFKLMPLIVSCLLNQFAESTTYDQRQTGDINVQVELNDLQIIALLKNGKEEYVDYDYVYDYSEMTIKPPNGKPPKPLNLTGTVTESMKENITTSTTGFIEETTESIIKNTTVLSDTTEILTNSTYIDSTTFKPIEEASSTMLLEELKNTTTPSSNCKKGFVQNSKGNCELKLQATSNALLKIVKLSQKLKLRRGNRRGEPGKA